MSDIEVALAAMRADAVLWESAATQLEAPKSALDGVTLSAEVVSVWAAEAGMVDTYDQGRTQVQTLLQHGAENFRAIAQALIASADTYQREEEANLHTFESTY